MRFALAAILAGFAVYAGWWFIARADRVATVQAFEAALDEAGVSVDYERITTRGFPSRLDTVVRGLVLEVGGRVWVLPEVEVSALSYRPRELIVTFPPSFSFESGGEVVTVTSERLRMSLSLARDGTVQAATVEGTGLAADPLGRAARVLVALRWTGGAEYDGYLEVLDAVVGADTLENARIDADLTLAGPIDGMRPMEALPVQAVTIAAGRVSWNGALADIEGTLGAGVTVTGPGAEAVAPFFDAFGG